MMLSPYGKQEWLTIIALTLGLIVAISAIVGVPSTVTGWMAPSTSTLWMWMGGLLVLSLVLGGIGYAVGKGTSR